MAEDIFDDEQKPIKYHYVFKFIDGTSTSIEVLLDPKTLNCLTRNPAPPEWARLSYQRCDGCPLDEETTEYCPVASSMAQLVNTFKGYSPHETAYVLVLTRHRDYSKSTTLQEGLSSLMGILMVSGGCPIMERLKPLVRYHLPFLTLEENVFRVVSMYFVIQHSLKRKGKRPDWDLKKLENIYDQIRKVNSGISRRLQIAARKDASLNALVTLDNTASLLPFVINETLDELEASLNSYLEDAQ